MRSRDETSHATRHALVVWAIAAIVVWLAVLVARGITRPRTRGVGLRLALARVVGVLVGMRRIRYARSGSWSGSGSR